MKKIKQLSSLLKTLDRQLEKKADIFFKQRPFLQNYSDEPILTERSTDEIEEKITNEMAIEKIIEKITSFTM